MPRGLGRLARSRQPLQLRQQAEEMRQHGVALLEIHQRTGVPVSTLKDWFREAKVAEDEALSVSDRVVQCFDQHAPAAVDRIFLRLQRLLGQRIMANPEDEVALGLVLDTREEKTLSEAVRNYVFALDGLMKHSRGLRGSAALTLQPESGALVNVNIRGVKRADPNAFIELDDQDPEADYIPARVMEQTETDQEQLDRKAIERLGLLREESLQRVIEENFGGPVPLSPGDIIERGLDEAAIEDELPEAETA